MLEIKHTVCQLAILRNRGQVTIMPCGDEPIVLAKASVSPNIQMAAGISPVERKGLENEYMLRLWLGRTFETKTQSRPFVSIREQWMEGKDVFRHEREVRLNLEPDFKRKPVNPYMAKVRDSFHLAFTTVPWQTASEGQRARVIFDQWRKKNCLKDMADWNNWIDFYRFTIACDLNRKAGGTRGINYTNEGAVGVLRRLFLRAYTRQAFGIVPTLSYIELAAWLNQNGYSTTVDEVKNAKRSKLVEHIVPEVMAVTTLLALLQAKFPTLDGNRFLAESNM